MGEQFHTSKPIYLQLVDRISRQIIRKELKPGDKLPSVRETAIQSGVNPNTVQRTYTELERMGIVETKRGQGTFVVDHEEIFIQLREELKRELILTFVEEMEEMGYSEMEMIQGLQDFLNQRMERGN